MQKLVQYAGQNTQNVREIVYLIRPSNLLRSNLRQSNMIELALCDESGERAHLVLDLVFLVYAGTFEVVEPLCAAELGVDAVDALSEILWTGGHVRREYENKLMIETWTLN